MAGREGVSVNNTVNRKILPVAICVNEWSDVNQMTNIEARSTRYHILI
jgi:hypothetical protein